jgi:hypothetical protein
MSGHIFRQTASMSHIHYLPLAARFFAILVGFFFLVLRYHVDSDQRRKDVGFHFENAFVLLSSDFWGSSVRTITSITILSCES